MTHYSLLMGSTSGAKAASGYTTKGAGQSFTITVPTGYNALHIQYSVGGGGGATGGISYDKAGGESSGRSGGSGAYLSDVIFSVSEGASYAANTGSGGAGGNQTANFGHPKIASSGTLSRVNGLFQLNPGGGASLTGGGVQGPLVLPPPETWAAPPPPPDPRDPFPPLVPPPDELLAVPPATDPP